MIFQAGRRIELADARGINYVATGHYVRIGESEGLPTLQRAADLKKDQSYFLLGQQVFCLCLCWEYSWYL